MKLSAWMNGFEKMDEKVTENKSNGHNTNMQQASSWTMSLDQLVRYANLVRQVDIQI